MPAGQLPGVRYPAQGRPVIEQALWGALGIVVGALIALAVIRELRR